jgi:hypothetical protein
VTFTPHHSDRRPRPLDRPGVSRHASETKNRWSAPQWAVPPRSRQQAWARPRRPQSRHNDGMKPGPATNTVPWPHPACGAKHLGVRAGAHRTHIPGIRISRRITRAAASGIAGSTAFVSGVGAPPRDRTSAGGGSVRNRAGKLLSRPFRRRGRSSARWPLRTMLLCCQGAGAVWTGQRSATGEGRLLVGHGPRWDVAMAVDSSFVEQPVEALAESWGSDRSPGGHVVAAVGRRCLKASRAT